MSGLDLAPPGAREVHTPGLLRLGALLLAGALLMQRLGRANPWFMGALVVRMGLTLSGTTLSAIPGWLTAAAQLVLGTSPGGIAEMAITAKVLQLGVPVVTALQVCRLVAVRVLAEPVFRWLGAKRQV